MSWERIPQVITGMLTSVTTSPVGLLLIINVFLLILGMFLEGTASLIILTPLLLPVAKSLGIDPIHLGIVMVVNITMGGMTPPFGTLIFVVCSTLKLNVTEFVKESLPFIAALILVLLPADSNAAFLLSNPISHCFLLSSACQHTTFSNFTKLSLP